MGCGGPTTAAERCTSLDSCPTSCTTYARASLGLAGVHHCEQPGRSMGGRVGFMEEEEVYIGWKSITHV